MVSVLTLVRGRQTHLNGLIASLCRQYHTEFELLIANMQPETSQIQPYLPFPVRLVPVAGTALPLAAARNAAASAAQNDHLAFLDVDCLAAPSLIGNYAHWLQQRDMVLMGEVRYLPAVDYTDRSFSELAAIAQFHPARPAVPDRGLREERNAKLFHATWGSWCMEYWLQLFHDRGYVQWRPEEGALQVNHPPTLTEIERARRPITEAFG